MHECHSCKTKGGAMDEPAIYVFEKNGYCKRCMEAINVGWRRRVDTAVSEHAQFMKIYKSGKYMVPREDILGYGKED